MLNYMIHMSLHERFYDNRSSGLRISSRRQVTNEVLVNMSTPDVMIFDQVIKSEYKHMLFEIDGMIF